MIETNTYGSTSLYFHDSSIPSGYIDPQKVLWKRISEINSNKNAIFLDKSQPLVDILNFL